MLEQHYKFFDDNFAIILNISQLSKNHYLFLDKEMNEILTTSNANNMYIHIFLDLHKLILQFLNILSKYLC